MLAILRSIASAEGTFALALLVAVTVLTALGHFSAPEWKEFSLYVFAVYTGGKTVTGAASAIAGRPAAKPAVTEQVVTVEAPKL